MAYCLICGMWVGWLLVLVIILCALCCTVVRNHMAHFAQLRKGARSLPELSSGTDGYDPMRSDNRPPASGVDAFRDEMAAVMATLNAGSTTTSKEADAKAASQLRRGRRAPSVRKTYTKEEGMRNDYDRERTPDNDHLQPNIKGWSSWQLTQVNKLTGELVCAATSFDPPWRAPEDKEGATISPDPGYHHSAVRQMSIQDMRRERAQRKLLIASGKPPVPMLVDERLPTGASQRREFLKMDFTNKVFSGIECHGPLEMALHAEDTKRGGGVAAIGLRTKTPNKMAASQRVNFFQYENKPGKDFSPHPGPISNPNPYAQYTPHQLKRERERISKTLKAQRKLAENGSPPPPRNVRVAQQRERGWRGPTPSPKPVFVEDLPSHTH